MKYWFLKSLLYFVSIPNSTLLLSIFEPHRHIVSIEKYNLHQKTLTKNS